MKEEIPLAWTKEAPKKDWLDKLIDWVRKVLNTKIF